MEQLLVTPLGAGEMMAAKVLPTLVIGLVMLLPALAVAIRFGVPFRGSWLAFLATSAALVASASAIGVLVASAARTLQQALFVVFFVLFPLLFLSGTVTPIESMPQALQWLTLASPLRYYSTALTGVMLKGVGLEVLWPQLAAMTGLAVGLFAAAAVVFRRARR